MSESVRVAPAKTEQSLPEMTGCIRNASLFQDPLVEEPPRHDAPGWTRQRYRSLFEQAARVCADCPLREDCLYDAVVEHDVAGIAAGTTQRERGAIRRELAITVEPENLDALAGTASPSRPVDHDDVVRLHRANPGESLESIAGRLGCSMSTVKRHLRQERRSADVDSRRRPRRPSEHRPTREQVMRAATRIVTKKRSARQTDRQDRYGRV